MVPSILVGLLFLSAVYSAISAITYWKDSSELRNLQAQAVAIEKNRAIIRALANDTLEYSKRNPSINPVLQPFGFQQPISSPKAAK